MIIGKNIGAYRILAKTRMGESGIVYKALHVQQRRTYALKLFRGDMDNLDTELLLFHEKLRILQTLNHPHIARVYPLESQGEYTIVPLDFLYGQNLSEKIADGPSTFDFALGIAIQAIETLIVAHEVGLVHTRLTSNTLFVSSAGELKILDFALCHLPEHLEATDPEEGAYATLTLRPQQPPLSKLAYLSPEQVRGRPADARSDLFSLGVILYELLLGEFLFIGEDTQSLYQQILERDLPRLGQVRPDAPSSWTKLLGALLEKDPTERYPSARDVLEDLERIREGLPFGQPSFRSKNMPISRRRFFRNFIPEPDQ